MAITLWHTTAQDPLLLQGFRFVKLAPGTRTSFWRFHTKNVSAEGTSTIEALYYFLKQRCEGLRQRHGEEEQCSCFDDILWLFVHQHQIIAKTTAERRAKARPHPLAAGGVGEQGEEGPKNEAGEERLGEETGGAGEGGEKDEGKGEDREEEEGVSKSTGRETGGD